MTRNPPPSTPHPVAPAGDDALSEERIADVRDWYMKDFQFAIRGSPLSQRAETTLALLTSLDSLRAENARLREELATLNDYAGIADDALDIQTDRLDVAKRAAEQLWNALEGKHDALSAANAEVERLRGLLVGLDDRADELMQTNSAYAAWVLAYNEALAALAPPGSESQKKGDG